MSINDGVTNGDLYLSLVETLTGNRNIQRGVTAPNSTNHKHESQFRSDKRKAKTVFLCEKEEIEGDDNDEIDIVVIPTKSNTPDVVKHHNTTPQLQTTKIPLVIGDSDEEVETMSDSNQEIGQDYVDLARIEHENNSRKEDKNDTITQTPDKTYNTSKDILEDLPELDQEQEKMVVHQVQLNVHKLDQKMGESPKRKVKNVKELRRSIKRPKTTMEPTRKTRKAERSSKTTTEDVPLQYPTKNQLLGVKVSSYQDSSNKSSESSDLERSISSTRSQSVETTSSNSDLQVLEATLNLLSTHLRSNDLQSEADYQKDLHSKSVDPLKPKKSIDPRSPLPDVTTDSIKSVMKTLYTDNDFKEKEIKDLDMDPEIIKSSNESTKISKAKPIATKRRYRVGLSRKAPVEHLHSYLG